MGRVGSNTLRLYLLRLFSVAIQRRQIWLSSQLLVFLLCVLYALQPRYALGAEAVDANPAKALVLYIEMDGDKVGTDYTNSLSERQIKMSEALRQRLADAGLFTVLRSPELLTATLAEQNLKYMSHCNGCEFDLAKQWGADVVVVPWIYRISNLLVILNCEVRDVKTEKIIFKRSLDFRGDNERAWDRSMKYLIEQMQEDGFKTLRKLE